MDINKEINPRFEDFVFDWDYSTYLLVGGYGSSKSYNIAFKLILKCYAEKRKVLVIREVYDTIRESCFDLFLEILGDMDLLEESSRKKSKKVKYKTSPMQLIFPNGSRIIFKGMDKPTKLKSLNGVSIVWLEEASEVKYAGYKELKGRLRHPTLKMHFFLSTNPVGTENWVYQHFFKRTNDDGSVHTILDDERLYQKRTIVKNGVYYHHSVVDDNYFVPAEYVATLDEMQTYDPDLYRVARLGRFGLNGIRVLPQFAVAESHAKLMRAVNGIPKKFHFTGFDFGFETSYNAVLRMAVDDQEKVLYIYWEYYKNHMTDDKTADELIALGLNNEQIIADSAEPKTIQYFRQRGFNMRPCRKYVGSRLENIKKIKRFKKIVCSPECINTIRELSTLTYAKDSKDNIVLDQFNIDPHTFSAIWYALDLYTVADVKEQLRYSKKGNAA